MNCVKRIKTIVLGLCVMAIFIVYTFRNYRTNEEAELYQYVYNQKLVGYKTIFTGNLPGYYNNLINNEKLLKDLNCTVDKCLFTTNPVQRKNADLVIFYEKYVHSHFTRPRNQLYAIFHLESPLHSENMTYPDIFNWTITYRYDSTITIPYSQWVYYDPDIKQKEQYRNYAANKTKMVAWFVSNCKDKNGRRRYALALQKYIEVDIYGRCGNMSCSRKNQEQCFDMLDKDYKFYLSFENSNCKDYITEKLFRNGLERNVLPIVMGAPPEDYAKYAPQGSYIHVDEFETPKKLAEYLHRLSKNDEMYNAYFKWKGTGEFIERNHFCDVCALLHSNESISTPKWFKDVNAWWNGPGICTTHSWRSLREIT